MPSKLNINLEGDNVGNLLDVISKKRAADAQRLQDTSDRIIHRAPLAPRMTHMCDESVEDDIARPGRDVTMKLSNVFEHLRDAAIALKQMHQVLGQVHSDVCPENLIMHYGKDGEIVYLLNDFDSAYTSRLNTEFYGQKARVLANPDSESRSDFENYTYEDLRKHLESSHVKEVVEDAVARQNNGLPQNENSQDVL